MRAVMARTPCGFVIRTPIGVAAPSVFGAGSNAKLECEDMANNATATPAQITTMRKRTAIGLDMFIRDRPRKVDCPAIAYIL